MQAFKCIINTSYILKHSIVATWNWTLKLKKTKHETQTHLQFENARGLPTSMLPFFIFAIVLRYSSQATVVLLGDLASAPSHVAADWEARWEILYHYPAVPGTSHFPPPTPCGRSLIILSWLILLWAHKRIWCIGNCHITGKIFILLVLLSVSAAREGLMYYTKGSTEAMHDSVQQNTLCLKVKYDIDW